MAGSELDFTAPALDRAHVLDTAFTDLQRDPDGMARVELDDTAGGRGVTLWMDEHFGYVMVFTGDTLEPVSRRRTSIAVEPMSCPPDALSFRGRPRPARARRLVERPLGHHPPLRPLRPDPTRAPGDRRRCSRDEEVSEVVGGAGLPNR